MTELQSYDEPPMHTCVSSPAPGPFNFQQEGHVFRNYGMIVRDWDSNLKRPAPFGDYLRPIYFNSGCAGSTCVSQTACPRGAGPIRPDASILNLFNRVFQVEENY